MVDALQLLLSVVTIALVLYGQRLKAQVTDEPAQRRAMARQLLQSRPGRDLLRERLRVRAEQAKDLG